VAFLTDMTYAYAQLGDKTYAVFTIIRVFYMDLR